MKFIGKRWTSIGMLSTVALFIMAASGFCATLNVPSGYSTIPAAINVANPGDIIMVAPGEYETRNDIYYKNDIQIIGAGQDETIICGSHAMFCFTGSSGCTVKGFRFENCSNGAI
ncbi:MAG: hypothetical protein ABIF87_17185 [Pseudomonadota bacterium]